MSSLTPSSVSGPAAHITAGIHLFNDGTATGGAKKKQQSAHFCGSAVFLRIRYFSLPSPAISSVISSIRSSGKGGEPIGFIATLISFMGLSSAAILLELSAPQRRQRCMTSAAALPVAGFDIDVKAAKTVRAVIAVIRPGIFRGDRPTAYLTGKAVSARVCFIVSFFKCSPLVFTVHGVVLLNDIFYISAGRFGSCSA